MAHATVSNLRDEILAKCRDSSYTLAHIIRYLNQGLQDVSTKVQLPALMAIDGTTITTSASANYVSLPTDFQRNLYKVHSTTNDRDIKVFSSPAALDKLISDLDQSGDVIGVAEFGSYIYYQKRAAETLQIYYMKEPTLLTLSSSQPTDIPEEHVYGLLVNYALYQIFTNKNDERAGEYLQLYEREIDRLSKRIGPERRPIKEVEDVLCLDLLY